MLVYLCVGGMRLPWRWRPYNPFCMIKWNQPWVRTDPDASLWPSQYPHPDTCISWWANPCTLMHCTPPPRCISAHGSEVELGWENIINSTPLPGTKWQSMLATLLESITPRMMKITITAAIRWSWPPCETLGYAETFIILLFKATC